MTTATALAPERLYRRCRDADLAFETTDALVDLDTLVGQEGAREAIELAFGVHRRGYNLFVLGPSGLGKRALVESLLAARAPREPAPSDWCYVNNFAEPDRPRALRLPPRRGAELRDVMKQLVEELRASIPALFESEEYRTRVEQIEAELSERQQQGFIRLGEDAARHDIALIHTPTGFSLAPMQKGEVLSPEQYDRLPEAERERLRSHLVELQEALQRVVQDAQRMQKEKRARIKALNREMCLVAVGSLIEDLRPAWQDCPAVLSYIDAVQSDLLDNIDAFRRTPEAEFAPFPMPSGDPSPLRRFRVNVIVGDGRSEPGAPVVTEDFPTHPNLLGRVEHIAQFGTLVTDFALIRAGALHRANGGYLLMDAFKLLTQPYAWDGLKRALSAGELRLESLPQAVGLISTADLEPEPIPLDVKVVLFGDRLVYYLMLGVDPEFGELFRVAADFEDDLPRTSEQEMAYARLVATLAHREQLLAFERSAVARLVEQAARWAGDGERLSSHLEGLRDLLVESDHFARESGATAASDTHVQQAIDARERRSGRLRRRQTEAILRGEILIDTSGEQVGQVNGLSVSRIGSTSFGHPTRITATTRLGDGEVIDIEREVEMGGPIHSKGVLILASFLAARYSPERPHSLAASLVFEQTYGAVEGDSASLAELAALMSAIGRFPLRQSLAITGSINQRGDVQPIGGVNEKIEGYFDICRARGLDGTHGVVIPQSNVHHLMLKTEVVEAAHAGLFAVYAVASVDDALELLSGLPRGTPDAEGSWSEDSFNARVAARLAEFALLRQAYATMNVSVRESAAPESSTPAASAEP